MNTLDSWEEYSKFLFRTRGDKKILALIKLVRAKDEALKIIMDNNEPFQNKVIDRAVVAALALTEELK